MSQDRHAPYEQLPLGGGRGSLPLGWGGQAAAVQGDASWPTSTFPPFSEEALLGGEGCDQIRAAGRCRVGPRWEVGGWEEVGTALGWGWGAPGRPWTVGMFSCSSENQDGWDCLVRQEGVLTGWGPRRGRLVWVHLGHVVHEGTLGCQEELEVWREGCGVHVLPPPQPERS